MTTAIRELGTLDEWTTEWLGLTDEMRRFKVGWDKLVKLPKNRID